jgi:hypothetical protein
VANAFIYFQNTNNEHQVILKTTALLCFPKNLIPWQDSNPGLLVPEADAMSTAPRRQGGFKGNLALIWCSFPFQFFLVNKTRLTP